MFFCFHSCLKSNPLFNLFHLTETALCKTTYCKWQKQVTSFNLTGVVPQIWRSSPQKNGLTIFFLKKKNANRSKPHPPYPEINQWKLDRVIFCLTTPIGSPIPIMIMIAAGGVGLDVTSQAPNRPFNRSTGQPPEEVGINKARGMLQWPVAPRGSHPGSP